MMILVAPVFRNHPSRLSLYWLSGYATRRIEPFYYLAMNGRDDMLSTDRSVCRVAVVMKRDRMRPVSFPIPKKMTLNFHLCVCVCFSNKFSSVDKHVRHLLRDVQSLAASYIHTCTRSSKTRGRWQRCEMWPSSSVCNFFFELPTSWILYPSTSFFISSSKQTGMLIVQHTS